MAILNLFVVFPQTSQLPLGVVLTKEEVDAIYSHLPPGATVQPTRCVRGEDGELYTVVAGPLTLLTAASLGARKINQQNVLARLSPDEIALLGLDKLKAEIGG